MPLHISTTTQFLYQTPKRRKNPLPHRMDFQAVIFSNHFFLGTLLSNNAIKSFTKLIFCTFLLSPSAFWVSTKVSLPPHEKKLHGFFIPFFTLQEKRKKKKNNAGVFNDNARHPPARGIIHIQFLEYNSSYT